MLVKGLDWADQGYRQVAGTCESGSEPTDYLQWGNFLTSCKRVSIS